MRFPVWCFFLLLGCAQITSRFEKTSLPQDSEPEKDQFVSSPLDPGGDADFRSARTSAFDPASTDAEAALRSFLEHHPSHPMAPDATLLLARMCFLAEDSQGCFSWLDRDPAARDSPSRTFLRGLCESLTNDAGKAVVRLAPFLKSGPPRIAGLPDPESWVFLHLSMARGLAASGDYPSAMDHLSKYFYLPGMADKDRAFARRQAETWGQAMGNEATLSAFSTSHDALTIAVLGSKAAAGLRARGDETGAARMEQETINLRSKLGFPMVKVQTRSGDLAALGLAVPLSGSQARLGEVIIRGASLVVFSEEHSPTPTPYRLVVRDSAAPAERSDTGGGASGAVLGLARQEGSIGVVTGHDPRAMGIAAQASLPLILLDERVPGAATSAFQMVHSTDARVTALAKRAFALGARRFAILGPDSPTGKRLGATFAKAVSEGNGTLTGHIVYPPATTSFGSFVQKLLALPFDALFIPEDANRLELITPALAVADLWPRQSGLVSGTAREAKSEGKGRREALLLSTALSVSPRLLQTAEKYIQGALLCPGFYPSEDRRGASFVIRFREIFGTSPSATDAYAYDAVSVLRSAVERGAKHRADVLRLLGSETFEGLTGDIRFGADHARIDPPIVYEVRGNTISPMK